MPWSQGLPVAVLLLTAGCSFPLVPAPSPSAPLTESDCYARLNGVPSGNESWILRPTLGSLCIKGEASPDSFLFVAVYGLTTGAEPNGVCGRSLIPPVRYFFSNHTLLIGQAPNVLRLDEASLLLQRSQSASNGCAGTIYESAHGSNLTIPWAADDPPFHFNRTATVLPNGTLAVDAYHVPPGSELAYEFLGQVPCSPPDCREPKNLTMIVRMTLLNFGFWPRANVTYLDPATWCDRFEC